MINLGSINCIGIVRLTRDADPYVTKMGTNYSFGIAAYRKFTKEGKQDVDFFDAQIFTKNPTPALEANLKKGKLLFIEGSALLNNKFVGKDGNEKSKIVIKIFAYEFFNAQSEPPKKQEAPKKEIPVDEEIVIDDGEEEIPF